MIWRIILGLFWTICPCLAITSGLYVDNGFDQTVIQEVLSSQEKRKMEEQLLNLLGLEERPRPLPRGIMSGSAPKFLLDVYSSLSLQDEEEQPLADQPLLASEFNLSKPDINAITQSDVIMSFTSHSKQLHCFIPPAGNPILKKWVAQNGAG
ncbi:hypothetical protein AAG570_001581 [Ranatra chinensis]|uniref:TGF-beta propeptide domain-containing protein n=1 Tax=Ranatra chinensis TaxID=642074 RepID=A0ABD0Y8Y5_9HEMI